MKKLVAVAVLSVVVLLAALSVSVKTVRTSGSYLDCASRLAGEAPPGDRLPPESFHRILRALGKSTPDLYLSRVLANECTEDPGTALRRFGRRLVALGTLKMRFPVDQREDLDAVFIPAYGGHGLTRSARAEWGRPPEALTDPEMTWLFVVGQAPSCSRAGVVPEQDRQACADIYKYLLSKLRRLEPAAPGS